MSSLCNEFEQHSMKGSQTASSNLGNRITKCKRSRILSFFLSNLTWPIHHWNAEAEAGVRSWLSINIWPLDTRTVNSRFEIFHCSWKKPKHYDFQKQFSMTKANDNSSLGPQSGVWYTLFRTQLNFLCQPEHYNWVVELLLLWNLWNRTMYLTVPGSQPKKSSRGLTWPIKGDAFCCADKVLTDN